MSQCTEQSKGKLIQISFAGNANLELVKAQLEKISSDAESSESCVEFTCCFLNRKMVETKGFSTEIVDLLESTLGYKLKWEADSYSNMEDFISNLDSIREATARTIDHLYVLDATTAKGVAREIELYTMGKVVLM